MSIQKFLDVTNVAKNSIPSNPDILTSMRVDVALLALAGEHINVLERQVHDLQTESDRRAEVLIEFQKSYDALLEDRNNLQQQLKDALQQIEDMKPAPTK